MKSEDLQGEERAQRIKVILGSLAVMEVLDHYDFEVLNVRPSYKDDTEEAEGVCPFHDSTSQNFAINLSSGSFFCRSAYCGARGDLINFVARQEHCSQVKAYYYLCDLAGIEPKAINMLTVTMAVLGSIGREKHVINTRTSIEPMAFPIGWIQTPHKYFTLKRGVDVEVQEEAKTGWVKDMPFYKYRACVPLLMNGKLYSMYSRAVASQSWWTKNNPEVADRVNQFFPKHHYTGESLTSHLLYGLDYVVERGFKELILVEAIISVLKLRSLGIHNAVAMLKSDISTAQIELIMKYGKFERIFICSDNDEKVDVDTGKVINPGMKSAWKSYKKLKKFWDVGVCRLPTNIDPAEMESRSEFMPVLDEAIWPQRRVRERKQIEEFFRKG